MKKATSKQIIEVAKTHDAIGFDGTYLYGVTNGEKMKYAVGCYRNSFHILAVDGLLKYNGDYTYSIVKA